MQSAKRPLLLIIVPTYNRANCLRLLLATLAKEIDGFGDRVSVLVSDNASSDETPEVARAFQALVPSAHVIRHEHNLGPDENFCRCVELADADYFWIIGDDDLPRAGAMRQILQLLGQQAPDLLYMQSDWRETVVDNDPKAPLESMRVHLLDRLEFARRVNVWTTFISGLIVRRDVFAQGANALQLRRYNGTNLVQLSWVLGTLERSRKLFYVPDTCVIATAGNTGGYAVLKVFGENFPAIVSERFGVDSPISNAMIRRCAVEFLPGLLWALRFGNVGKFARENPSAVLRPQLGRYAVYPLLVLIGRAPKLFAGTALVICKLVVRGLRVADRVRGLFGRTTSLA
jgi:glycosyltransferase involved in cell wall biosynthesis